MNATNIHTVRRSDKETGAAPALKLSDIRKTYPGASPVEVLHGIDLTIGRGELMAIVGPSGSGKSTLLHIMGTLERPTSGKVAINRTDVTSLSDNELAEVRAQQIGFVFQQFFLLEGLSALENVATGLLYSGSPKRERRALAELALERVGLAHRLTHRPNQLSGGERQRVAIARALVGDPSIVLADEPTGNLDSVTSESIVDLLRALHTQGTTLAVITHDHELAARMPRAVRIEDGSIVSDLPQESRT